VSVLTLSLTAISLSTDAFAAALARGSREVRPRALTAVRVGAVFGGAEGLMALAGWMAARTFAPVITALDHWIALILLCFIGVRMIREGLASDAEPDEAGPPPGFATTILTALGTSVDSAAVGVALGLSGASAYAALVIGLASFSLSTIGYLIGPYAREALGKKAEILGGLVLIAIGVSIFVDHTWGG